MPGLPFIAENVALRAVGGADAAIGDFHHPDAEEIDPGLDAVVPRAAAGGIAGFEGDAEVEHGSVKKTCVYLTISRPLDFPACCGQGSHGRNQSKESIRRREFLYKP